MCTPVVLDQQETPRSLGRERHKSVFLGYHSWDPPCCWTSSSQSAQSLSQIVPELGPRVNSLLWRESIFFRRFLGWGPRMPVPTDSARRRPAWHDVSSP